MRLIKNSNNVYYYGHKKYGRDERQNEYERVNMRKIEDEDIHESRGAIRLYIINITCAQHMKSRMRKRNRYDYRVC